MTTDETERRGQLGIGVLLVLIGLLMVGQTVYWNQQDAQQGECLADNFQDLSIALDARASVAERESEQNRALWSIYAEAAGIVQESGLPAEEALSKEQQAELNAKLVEQLIEYDSTIEDLQQERKDNPLPPYPAGACQ